MKKLLFLLFLVPCCMTLTVGCSSSEPAVVQPGADETEETEAAEAAEAEEEMETTE